MAKRVENQAYLDLLDENLSDIDGFVQRLIRLEKERQARKLILIPSESMAPRSVRRALGSVFNNVYAEGYPRFEMTRESEEKLADLAEQLTHYRRYADRRFYKGVEYADLVESLAQRRAAECFANSDVSAEEIYVNVQPLSGAAANLAIYETFVNPGDTVMGMDLSEGGHLTHGSKFNITGKRYNIVSYSTKRSTGKLDYDEIEEMALEHRPKMIIVGYTSYPWAPDWKKFREIADKAGAVLLADIAHTAGMAIAGAYPNPIRFADIVMFTTHKTICGPRGAVILTTNQSYSERIDEAIFPGEQGGPHVNKWAAMAVAFKIAQTKGFKKMQHQIVKNSKALAKRFKDNGIDLAYGGTDTHLMVIDLRKIQSDTGFTLMGEVGARILDLCGIVTNKNTIPGDESAAEAHGIRLGTPWVTQRGMREEEMEALADIITQILTNIKPFCYLGVTGELSRGKIDLGVLEKAKEEVAQITQARPPTVEEKSDYPHFYGWEKDREVPVGKSLFEKVKAAQEESSDGPLLFDFSDKGVLEISGHRPTPFLQEVTTNDVYNLQRHQAIQSFLLDKEGVLIDSIAILRTEDNKWGQDRYLVITAPEEVERIKVWFRELSDGYVIFDKEDLFRKVQGPITLNEVAPGESAARAQAVLKLKGGKLSGFIDDWGGAEITEAIKKDQGGKIKLSECNVHIFPDLSSKNDELYLVVDYNHAKELVELLAQNGVGLATPEMKREEYNDLLKLSDKGRISALTLYQNGYENLFCPSKTYFVGQSHLLKEVSPSHQKKKFHWAKAKEESEGHRTPLYEEHKKLGAKMTNFAGWTMPVWYSGVGDEHRAVRQSAGIFDLGHMGVFEVSGKHATSFLDAVTSNYVRWLKDGESQYSYLLDPQGVAIDDIIVYRRREDLYLVIGNAANQDVEWQWLNAVNSREFIIDKNHPVKEIEGQATLRNLKDPKSGDRQRINLALQGAKSLPILKNLISDSEAEKMLNKMGKNELIEIELAEIPVVISHTGYTGEEIGYEIFVHPQKAPTLWNRILDAGHEYNIKPCGLGARDSLRTEAGLPLFGHELEGKYDINPTEAGFGPYIKFHKPFFIGREEYIKRTQEINREVVRFKIDQDRARAIRTKAPVIDRAGKFIGRVTSCTLVGDGQVGMAYIDKKYHREGEQIGVFASPASFSSTDQKSLNELESGDRVPLYYWARVLSRFPGQDSDKPGFSDFSE